MSHTLAQDLAQIAELWERTADRLEAAETYAGTDVLRECIADVRAILMRLALAEPEPPRPPLSDADCDRLAAGGYFAAGVRNLWRAIDKSDTAEIIIWQRYLIRAVASGLGAASRDEPRRYCESCGTWHDGGRVCVEPSAGPWRVHVDEVENDGFGAKPSHYWYVMRGKGKICAHCNSGVDYDESYGSFDTEAEAIAVRDALNKAYNETSRSR